MRKNHKFGYTLMELSIVLLVLSLMIGSIMAIANQNIRAKKQTELQEKLTRIQEALLIYRKKNGRLPCPANITELITAANFGKEGGAPKDCNSVAPAANFTDGSENVFGGGVPVKTLNLSLQDAFDPWGNRFLYVVATDITSNIGLGPFAATKPYNDTIGNITVRDNESEAITTKALYVVISHGENGHGAYGQSGVRISAESVNTFEQGNCHCNASAVATAFDGIFYQVTPKSSATSLDTFDDILIYATRAQMLSSTESVTE